MRHRFKWIRQLGDVFRAAGRLLEASKEKEHDLALELEEKREALRSVSPADVLLLLLLLIIIIIIVIIIIIIVGICYYYHSCHYF